MSKYRQRKSDTDPFDELFMETHGGTGAATWEDADDIPEHDDMDDDE